MGIFLEVWAICPGHVGKIIDQNKDQTTVKHILKLPIGKSFRDFFRQKIQAFPDSLAEPLLRRCGKLWHLGGTLDVEKCHVMCSVYIYMFISSLGTRLLQDECLLQKKSNLYTLFYISYNFHICDMTESFDSQVCCFREPSRLLDP